jgi:hypothetical protein
MIMLREQLLLQLTHLVVSLEHAHPLRIAINGIDAAGKTTFQEEEAPANAILLCDGVFLALIRMLPVKEARAISTRSRSRKDSDRFQRSVWFGRQLDNDRVAGSYLAACTDDSHDASLTDECAALVSSQYRRHQPWLKAVQLDARITQAGHFNYRSVAQAQPRAGWKSKQINAACRDILAHLPG